MGDQYNSVFITVKLFSFFFYPINSTYSIGNAVAVSVLRLTQESNQIHFGGVACSNHRCFLLLFFFFVFLFLFFLSFHFAFTFYFFFSFYVYKFLI